jgi:plastocyanin
MKDFSLDDLRAVLGAVPPEPVVPDRAAAVRRRVRQARQRRAAAGAVALSVPAAGFGVLRGDADGSGDGSSGIDHPAAAASPSARPMREKPASPVTAPTANARPTVSRQAPTGTPTKPKPARPVVHPGPGLTVSFTPSTTEVEVGEEVDFSLSWSDNDGHWRGYALSWGNIGSSRFKRVVCESNDVFPRSARAQFPHAWSEPGVYHVTYTVHTGGCGAVDESVTSAVDITVRAAEPEPAPTAAPSPAPEPSASAAVS